MARKSKRKTDSSVECLDVYEIEDEGFIEGDYNFGNSVATFSFGEKTDAEIINKAAPKHFDSERASTAPRVNNHISKTSSRGITPPVDGEQYTVKRCYQYRPSTVRKLNELKAKHPDVNVYLNTIIDEAIVHFYDHIFNGDGNFNNR